MSTGGLVEAVTVAFTFTILGQLFKTKSPKATTQRIGELSQQTAKEGEPRPIVWGRVRPISGNIMHSSPPRIITREVKGQSSGGGKGGKKKQPKQYEERVFRTYAIRICEGPITAIIRVWRNNKLVYDARGNAWGRKNNSVFTKRARFYLGDWTQMPDPTLESKWGAGNVPAYRGTCYMVVPDEDLTELGGAIPQYIYEVERAEGIALTSLPYAIDTLEKIDSTDAGLAEIRAPLVQSILPPEGLNGEFSLVAMSFRTPLVEYEYQESIESDFGLQSVNFRRVSVGYDTGAESIDSNQYLQAMSHRVALIKYENYPVENIDSDHYLEAIHHANP